MIVSSSSLEHVDCNIDRRPASESTLQHHDSLFARCDQEPFGSFPSTFPADSPTTRNWYYGGSLSLTSGLEVDCQATMWAWFEYILSCCSSSSDVDEDRPRRPKHSVVLVGPGGVGKGNIILGRPIFDCGPAGGADSVSDHKCEIATVARLGRILSLVDTPGFDDASTNLQETRESVVQLTGGKLDAIALLLPAMKVLVPDLEDALKNIKILFGEQALTRTFVVITRDNRIKGTLKQILGEKEFAASQALFNTCKGGVTVFNNDIDPGDEMARDFELQVFMEKVAVVQRPEPYDLFKQGLPLMIRRVEGFRSLPMLASSTLQEGR